MNLKSIRTFFLFILFLINFSFAQVSIKPGEISYIEVQYNNILVAGEAYNINLKFTDAFGNPSNNFGLASKIKVVSNGLEISKSEIYPGDIKNGEIVITVKGKKTGFYSLAFFLDEKPLILKVLPLEALTSSMNFRVINNKAEIAVIESKDSYLPGYPYEIKISFFDREGNPVLEKSHINQTFLINANGGTKEVNINDFNGNVYKFDILPFVVEDFNIVVQDKSNKNILASKTIKPEIQTIGKIKVITPSETEAGKPFTLEIKVYDAQDRLIKVYDKIGADIKLKVNGSGRIIPDIIPKEAFVEGVAQIQAIYTKSETINIEPVILGLNTSIDVEKKAQKEEKKIVEQPKKEQELRSEKKSEQIPEEKEKKATTVKLKFLLELGIINKISLISAKEGNYTYKVYFSKRNLDYEVRNYERDILIEKENVGKLNFVEDKDHNIILNISLKDGYTAEASLLKDSKNTVEVKVMEK
ncbi:sugar-binding protein [Sulfurihydrogenibium sp.]|jgi:hypothetical protein|uniref:sugar-binding protein n=1 Tax=Sulfurihydrogenibium sp. TaxID=2053621 RepID=UPI0026073739|nr:sugar-binding protein [Sulfurihydrogenibium sp.]